MGIQAPAKVKFAIISEAIKNDNNMLHFHVFPYDIIFF